MTSCVVPRCKNGEKVSGVSYFTFPKDVTRRLIWTILLRKWMKDPTWNPKRNTRICSGHFPAGAVYDGPNGRRRLKKYAVPQMSPNDDDAEYEEETEETDGADEESNGSVASNEVELIRNTPEAETDCEVVKTVILEQEENKTRFMDADETRNGNVGTTNNFIEIGVNSSQLPETREIDIAQTNATIEVLPTEVAQTYSKEIVESQTVNTLHHDGKPEKMPPKRKSNEVEKFKRRIIRAVARQISENSSEEEFDKMWQSMNKESKCDCKLLWERMRTLTLKKLRRLLPADDRTDSITNIARLTATDWLLFDLVLVHENVDVIGQDLWANTGDEPEVLYELFFLIERYSIDDLKGTDLIDAWLNLTREYNEGDRKCSPMMLQRRWFQMKETARKRFYMFWGNYRGNASHWERARPHKPTNLQIDVVRKHRNIITEKFSDWSELIAEGRVILAQKFDERITAKRKGFVEDVEPDLELVEQNVEIIDVEGDSDSDEIANEKGENEASETNVDTGGLRDCMKAEAEEIPIDIDEMDSLRLLQSIHIPCETPFGRSEEPAIVDFDTATNECSSQTISRSTIIETPFFDGPADNDCVGMEINPNTDMLIENKNVDTQMSVNLYNLDKKSGIVHEDGDGAPETDVVLPKITNVTSIATLPAISDEDKEPITSDEKIVESQNLSNVSHGEDQTSNIVLNEIESEKVILDNFELPSDIQFADDGIMLDDEDDDANDCDSAHDISNVEAENETNGETDTRKIDLKLLLFPTVYTKKLEDMDIFKFLEFDQVRDKRAIERAIMESKPTDVKNVNMEDIAREENEESSERESDGDEDIMLRNLSGAVSWSSWLLQKPRVNSYNPIQLCKNPDFNTRLKRLTAGFLSHERNRRYLQECKPLTIDLHKSFEVKLVNETLHLKDVPVSNLPMLHTDIYPELTTNPPLTLLDVKLESEPDSIPNTNASEFLNSPVTVARTNTDFTNALNPAAKPNTSDMIKVDQLREPNSINNTLNMDSSIQASPLISHNSSEDFDNVNLSFNTSVVESMTNLNNSAVAVLDTSPPNIQTGQTNPADRKRVVNLPDIHEVRRTNQKLLCAEVAPIQSASNSPSAALLPFQHINYGETDKIINSQNIVKKPKDVSNINITTPSTPQPKVLKRGRPKSKKTPVNENSMENSGVEQNQRNTYKPSISQKCKAIRTPKIPWIEPKLNPKSDDILITSDTVEKMIKLFSGETFRKKKKSNTNTTQGTTQKGCRKKKAGRRQSGPDDHNKNICCWARKKAEIGTDINIESHLCPKEFCMCCCKHLLTRKRLSQAPKRWKKKLTAKHAKNDPIILSDDEDKKMEEDTNRKIKITIESMDTGVMNVRNCSDSTDPSQCGTTLKADSSVSDKRSLPLNKSGDVSLSVPNESHIAQRGVQTIPENYMSDLDLAIASLETKNQVYLEDQHSNVAMNITVGSSSPLYNENKKVDQPTVLIQNTKILSRPVKRNIRTHVKARQQSSSYSNVNIAIRGHLSESTQTKGAQQRCTGSKPKSPVYIGRNKILLCTKVNAIPQAQTNDVTSVVLPTGVHLVMLPNKEIAMSIDPGVELNQFQIEELQNIIRNIQTQVNTLPSLNNVIKTLDKIDANNLAPVSDVENKKNGGTVTNLFRNETERSRTDVPESSNNIQLESNDNSPSNQLIEINSGITSEDSKAHQNNTDSVQTVTQNEEINNQSTSTARKTILSDLMEMSGISEEDAKSPEISNPKPYITLDPVNIPFLKVSDNPSKSASKTKEPDIPASALTALASRPDLRIVSAYSDLKEAFHNKCSFYKLDIETGEIAPVNVCIKKKYPADRPAPVLRGVVDLTEDNEDKNGTITCETAAREENKDTKEISNTATPLKLFRAIHPSILRNGAKGMSLIKTYQSVRNGSLLKRVDAKKILKIVNSHKRKISQSGSTSKDLLGPDKEDNDDSIEEDGVSAKRPLSKDTDDSDESDDEPLAKIVKRRTELAAYSVQNVESTGIIENDKLSTEEMTLLEMPNDILMEVDTNPESQVEPPELDSDEDCILGV